MTVMVIFFEAIKLLEKAKTEIFLTSLIFMLFIFDRESAINFVKILIVFTLSSNIMKNHFSHLIIKLSDHESGRIYEYTFIAIFTFFIFIEIEFLLNGLYVYAFFTFIFLLVFTGAALYLFEGGESKQAAGCKK